MLDKIRKSIEIISSYGDSYDVKIEVYENDFTVKGFSESLVCDVLFLDDVEISIENLNDMYFPIDGEFKSLGQILDLIGIDIYDKIAIYNAEYSQEQADEIAMRQELSSPYLTGRI